jgi:hypothetical protein
MMRAAARTLSLALLASFTTTLVSAHDGPPFPIVSDRRTGAYIVSVWTDPDTTDDGTAGGQFWVMLARAEDDAPVPDSTRVRITAIPLDRAGDPVHTEAAPVRNQPATQFGAVVLDHEGRFRVQVEIDGPAGPAVVDAEVDATYDLRPPPIMLILYLLPFLVVGVLWAKLLIRRRGISRRHV